MQFFDILDSYFPAHRLIASDFSVLPDAVPGLNAPVVQTRYMRRTVPVSTPFVSSSSDDLLAPFLNRMAADNTRSTKAILISSSLPTSTSSRTSIVQSPAS